VLFPLSQTTAADDEESEKCHLGAIIVRDVSIVVSNYRSVMSLDEYCKKHNVMGLSNLDTRALTKVLRETGCLNGVICTGAASLTLLCCYSVMFDSSSCSCGDGPVACRRHCCWRF
jgi:carbamoylphosphate synthase small subunit